MADALTIKPAIESDLSVLLSLIQGLAQYEKLPITANARSLRETLFGPRPYAEVLIARLGEMPIGYALFFHTYSTFLASPGLYLEDLFVMEEHRSKGIGHAMLAQVARIALQRNCIKFEWTVLEWNTRAIDFYRRLGASIHSEWKICRVMGNELQQLADLK